MIRPTSRRTALLLCAALAAACHRHDHAAGHDDHAAGHGDPAAGHGDHAAGHGDHGHGGGHDAEHERPSLAFTHWTAESELFVEIDTLVVGQDSNSAAHVTRLSDFTPLAQGTVTVVLKGGPGEERFSGKESAVAGIFRPVTRPTAPGKRQLVMEVRGPGVTADHALGEVTVYESIAAARAAHPEEPDPPGIGFTKEQQWPLGLTTALVREHPVRATVPVLAEVRARPEGDVLVVAPVAGRLTAAGTAFPRLGNPTRSGEVLALLAPRLEADRATLELDAGSAALALKHAQRERERALGLRDDGVVSERRLAEATRAVDEARLALRAARARLAQFRGAAASGAARGGVELRAPLEGTVTAVEVGPGAFVEAGAPLFRVTDTRQPWIVARVAEADLPRLGTPGAASFDRGTPDERWELPATALVARAATLDPRTRTLELFYQPGEGGAPLVLGATLRGRVATGPERPALAVPEGALVDDAGTTVVYVQAEGERFERRVVQLGARDAGRVEVLAGVKAGERVAVKHAWSVKLASAGGAVPAHGHAH